MNEVLTVDEVAEYLRVHPMTVQRWCRSGSLTAAKIGRAYRIKKVDLDLWWEQRCYRGVDVDRATDPMAGPRGLSRK